LQIGVIVLTACLGGVTVRAQQLDSELVQMAYKGGCAFGGMKASRSFHKVEENLNSNTTLDSARTDTIAFDISTSWHGLYGFAPSYTYPNLQYFQPVNGLYGKNGFSFDIDTIHKRLSSLSCVYDNDNQSSAMTLSDEHEISIDTIPYTISGGTLIASLRGQSLFLHLTKLYVSYYYGYAGGGINGSIIQNYSLFGDSSSAYFSFYLDGATDAVLKRNNYVQGLQVYPIPCKDVLNVSLPFVERRSIRVYDLLGRMRNETQVPQGGASTIRIDTHNLPNGRYILTTQNSSVAFSVQR
jgi:hypothetical protein